LSARQQIGSIPLNGNNKMGYWIHLIRSLDQAIIHRDRCLEIPSGPHRADYWVGGWEEYPDKDTALEALENSDAASQLRCPVCKP
jgi:hypothetical protein